MSDITITGYCVKCHQWATPDFLATLRLSAHAGGDVCLNCLADKSWSYLKRHVCSADYPKVARYKQFAEIPQLQSDNISLMEQMNKMVCKPNQEIIEWHECSEGVPTDSGHYLILCEDGDVFIDWYNNGSDEAGNPEDHCPWGDPEWRIEVQDPGAYKVIAWAYLPKGIKYEN